MAKTNCLAGAAWLPLAARALEPQRQNLVPVQLSSVSLIEIQLADTGKAIAETAPASPCCEWHPASNGAPISIHICGGAHAATAAARLEFNGTEGDLLLTLEAPTFTGVSRLRWRAPR